MTFSIAKLNRLPKKERDRIYLSLVPKSIFERFQIDHKTLTPFRRKGMERSIRGRSWAINDGIFLDAFDEEWESPVMYRTPGKDFKVNTFPGQIY